MLPIQPKLAASVACLCLLILMALKEATATGHRKLFLGDDHAAADADEGFCILTMDSRFSAEDMTLVASKNQAALEAAWAVHASKTIQSHTLWLNVAYSLRHGYPLLVSTGTEYEAERGAAGVHWAWVKLAMARDTLADRPDCRWLMWVDSDAFLWMDHHRVRLETMFATTAVHELSRDFRWASVQHMHMQGHVPLRLRPHVHFMIGMNGVSGGEPEMGGGIGFPNKFLDIGSDYLCTGTWVVRNSPTGAALIQNWWDSRMTDPQFNMNHPFEQRSLNSDIYPEFQHNTSVYSYLYFNSPDSPTIRHFWRTFEGHEVMRLAAFAVALLTNNTGHQGKF